MTLMDMETLHPLWRYARDIFYQHRPGVLNFLNWQGRTQEFYVPLRLYSEFLHCRRDHNHLATTKADRFRTLGRDYAGPVSRHQTPDASLRVSRPAKFPGMRQ